MTTMTVQAFRNAVKATSGWRYAGLNIALNSAIRAARTLENLEGAPDGEWLYRVGLALRMWASAVRSIHNFYHAQRLRERYEDILSDEKRVPVKQANWEGDPGNLSWNEIMRDELDNTAELIAMLENGGIDLVAKAETSRHEGTFLLGPDLIPQLKKKLKIMRAHWLDVQGYLAPPHK